MANFIKRGKSWKQITNIYKKINGGWESESNTSSITSNIIFMVGGSPVEFMILCGQNIVGESAQVNAKYDGVLVTGATYTVISGGEYVIINQDGLLTILTNANSSSVTIKCEYLGLTTTKEISVTYKSGTTSETTVVDNGDGTSTETTTEKNSDGSSTSSSVTTDENGNVIGKSNNTTDSSGNSSTKEISVDENGNETVTGYVIDTSKNENGGLVVNEGVDTGIIAFNGKSFTIHLKANFDISENVGNIIVCATEPVSSGKYAGFELMVYSGTRLCLCASTNGELRSTGVFGSQLNTYRENATSTTPTSMQYLKTGKLEYTFDIEYIPTNGEIKKYIKLDITPLYSNTTYTSKIDTRFVSAKGQPALPDSLSNATISIGEFNGNGTHKIKNFEIIELEVRKS